MNLSKRILAVLVLLIVSISLSACGKKYKAVKPDKDPTKLVQDKNYTEDLKKEKEISNGQVYVQNNTVIATMIIKDGVKKEEAKALAEKYANNLKKTYKGMPINVQAVQNGNNVANITLNK
ncbi:MAG: hypothetical protein VB130_06835 [Clostridium sp.]|nr:hypothetical protein [Clostridium sp.]